MEFCLPLYYVSFFVCVFILLFYKLLYKYNRIVCYSLTDCERIKLYVGVIIVAFFEPVALKCLRSSGQNTETNVSLKPGRAGE